MNQNHIRLTVALIAVVFAGCAQTNDPFRDSAYNSERDLETASAAGFRSTPDDGSMTQPRTAKPGTIYYHNTRVAHWPLWFENPFIDKGNGITDPDNRDAGDDTFAVNAGDVFAVPYSIARTPLNAILWPISAVVQHPGMVMASDGKLSRQILDYDHDASAAGGYIEPPFTANRDLKMAESPDELVIETYTPDTPASNPATTPSN